MKTATKCLFGGALLGAGLCNNVEAGTIHLTGALVQSSSSYSYTFGSFGYGGGSYTYNRGPTSIDVFSFSVSADSLVTIDALSWQVTPTWIDPMLFLFVDDAGPLSSGNLITSNDDSSSDGNGSVVGLDSFISVFLTAGDYKIAIAGFFASVTDVAAGFNFTRVWTHGPVGPGIGEYEIDITDTAVAVVPLPPAAFGGLAMLAGLGAYRRVRR